MDCFDVAQEADEAADEDQYARYRRLRAEAEATGPREGMPVTYAIGGDRYPGTVVIVNATQTRITVRLDHGTVMEFSKRGNGQWVQKGLRPHQSGEIWLDVAEERRDPAF